MGLVLKLKLRPDLTGSEDNASCPMPKRRDEMKSIMQTCSDLPTSDKRICQAEKIFEIGETLPIKFNWCLLTKSDFGNPPDPEHECEEEKFDNYMKGMGKRYFNQQNFVEAFIYTKTGRDVFFKCSLKKYEQLNRHNVPGIPERLAVTIEVRSQHDALSVLPMGQCDVGDIPFNVSSDKNLDESSYNVIWWKYTITYQEVPEELQYITFNLSLTNMEKNQCTTMCCKVLECVETPGNVISKIGTSNLSSQEDDDSLESFTSDQTISSDVKAEPGFNTDYNCDAEHVMKYLQYIFLTDDPTLKLEASELFLLPKCSDSDAHALKLVELCENSALRNMKQDEEVLHTYHIGEDLKSSRIMEAAYEQIKKNKKMLWRTIEQLGLACQQFPKLMYRLAMED